MMLFLSFFVLILQDVTATLHSPSKQLVSGYIARPCEFPHMAFLSLKFFKGQGFCGGSILNKDYILTSARCLEGDLREVTVKLGSAWNDKAKQQIKAEKWMVHPDFQNTFTKIVNDVALVKLKSEIKFDECVQPIRLPKKGQQLPEECTISGWGFLGDHMGPSRILNRASVQFIPMNKCRATYPGIYLDQHICVGEQVYMKPSICLGDSGGPLTCTDPSDNKNFVAGVASYTYSCNEGFSVFVKIENFVNWLKNNMRK